MSPETSEVLGAPAAAPRVLIVGNFLSRRVSTRAVCEELADRLTAAGWQVLRTSDRPGRLPRLVGMQRSIWRFRHRFDVAQVDVFSGAAFVWAEAAAWSLGRLGKPFVLTLHGGLLPEFGRRWPRRLRRLLCSATAVTTPSSYLETNLSPYRDDLLLLPNPLELSRYAFRPRAMLSPRLVWLRAFHHTYNPLLAVEVLACLRPRFPDVRLTMIGPDKGDGSLEATRQRARQLGVEGPLTLIGGVAKEDVPAALAQGDVFLNTTNADNTPVSVMEAMACGLAVVSTDVGGLAFLLEDGRDARLVPPRDPDAMAAAVGDLLERPTEACTLCTAARAKVEAFDWSRVLPRWQDLLRQVAAQGALP
ncbi:MAG: glycosyltransferase family 4 protein [Acidobacteria bacterium]|nr:glycosyltransferase family 4 protein [Acidobacteriota bacterium]